MLKIHILGGKYAHVMTHLMTLLTVGTNPIIIILYNTCNIILLDAVKNARIDIKNRLNVNMKCQ